MAPYRTGREEQPGPAAPGAGLVGDMVRQFADPYAFLRELAQNSMDAGATRIAVRVERAPDGVVATSVSDDGSGMSREIVEGPLLTLFSSSKEGDEGKIGKYGVGFVSVFAIGPDAVEVETWRDGQAWRLVLRPDTSYELEDAGPREGSGTRVTLIQRMDGEGLEEHAARVGSALRRWCRHADRAIELRVPGPGGEPREPERIDAPLTVLAPASVRFEDGDLTGVVGPSAGTQHLDALTSPWGWRALAEGDPELGPRFAGFYNRGLTLYETADEAIPGLAGVRFKVMSRRFQHTLSRDNVRRDEAFREAIARVREASRGPLRREIQARLGPAAAEAAAGRELGAYLGLVEAALTPPTALEPEAIPFPLASALNGGARTAAADLGSMAGWRAPILMASAPDRITEALAQRGVPVVLVASPEVRRLLGQCYPKRRLAEAHATYVMVSEKGSGEGRDGDAGGDASLVRALAEALGRARRDVYRIALSWVEGALAARAGVLLPEPEGPGPQLALAAEVEARARRWRAADVLHLNVASRTVDLARRQAATEPAAAAALLARALLLEAGRAADEDEGDLLLDLGEAGAAPRGLAAPRASRAEPRRRS